MSNKTSVAIRRTPTLRALAGERSEPAWTFVESRAPIRAAASSHPSDPRRLTAAMRRPLEQIAQITAVLRDCVNDDRAYLVGALSVETARMDRIVEDLAAFARFAMPGSSPTRRRLDLRLVCERVIDKLQHRYPERRIVLVAPFSVMGSWDPDDIALVVEKLAENALDHGLQKPAPKVKLGRLGAVATIEVWNAGRPLDPVVVRSLRQPFKAAELLGSQGLGLGLYLASEAARLHGGGVEIHSDRDTGTTVTVTLPSQEARGPRRVERTA